MSLGELLEKAKPAPIKSKLDPWGVEVWFRPYPLEASFADEDRDEAEPESVYVFRVIATCLCDEEGNLAWDPVEKGIAVLRGSGKDFPTIEKLFNEIGMASGILGNPDGEEDSLPSPSTNSGDTKLQLSLESPSGSSEAA